MIRELYENVLNAMVISAEAIAMLICIHTGFGKKIQINLYGLLFTVFYVAIFLIGEFAQIGNVLDIIFMFIWTYLIFRESMLQTAFRYIVSIILLGFVQIIGLLMYQVIVGSVNEAKADVMYFVVSCLNIVLAYIINAILAGRNDLKYNIRSSLYMYIYIILVIVLLIYMKSIFEDKENIPFVLYLMCFITMILTGVGIVKEQKTKFTLDKRELEIGMTKLYDEAYKELFEEVRRKQHDYNNQISAICSSHLVATSLEELVKLQKEYVGMVIKDNKYNNILTGCKSRIMAGYIYNKCIQYEQKGIELSLDVLTLRDEYIIQIYEIIEILGILLNNAYEHIEGNNHAKIIKLKIVEKNDRLEICVANPAKYLTYTDIEKMFKLGYSTKGKQRGIGLNSLRKLVEKYSGDIIVESIEEEKMFWLYFKVII